MELVVRKNELLRELQLFQGIVERKNTIPILANVLVDAKGDHVRMLATDLEVALRSQCAATVAKAGVLTLPAKKLYEIVKALPETDVRIEQDKSGVRVAAERFDSRMQTLPREDFPVLPEGGGGAKIGLPRPAIRQMVAKTQFAITGEDTRFFLNGAKFILKPDSLTLVATDGHRLALVDVKHKLSVTGEVGVILPRKHCSSWGNWLSRAMASRLRTGREPPVLRRRRPHVDLANDRRTVSGVRARDSERQRQDDRVRSRAVDQCRQACGPAVQ
jgi:DNA polymerase-3 subunit beta